MWFRRNTKIYDWDEFKRRVRDIDFLRFMNRTCRQSIENYWKKRDK